MEALPHFYFIVTFWGKKYKDYFCQFILPSLLSPGNIPSLTNKWDSRFLIVTTATDWQELQQEPIFKLMLDYIEPVYFEMPMPEDNSQKMLVMSKGHKLASEYAFQHKAVGVFVTPDLVISDGSIRRLEELVMQGKHVVLSAAIRFQYEGSVAAMRAAGHLVPGEPLVLSGRELMRMVLPNLHSEVKRYIWDRPYYPQDAISSIWYANEHNCVIHTFSWGPMALDYGAIQKHCTTTFDNWTLDGDYVYANYGADTEDSIYVVNDTDELAFASFTTEEELHFEPQTNKYLMLPVFSKEMKLLYLNEQYHSGIMDPLKRKLIKIPVLFHADDIGSKMTRLKQKTINVIEEAITLKVHELLKRHKILAVALLISSISHNKLVKKYQYISYCTGLNVVGWAAVNVLILFAKFIFRILRFLKISFSFVTRTLRFFREIFMHFPYLYKRALFRLKNREYKQLFKSMVLVIKQMRWRKGYTYFDDRSPIKTDQYL